MEKHTITYLKEIPLLKKILAAALVLLGIWIFITSSIFGGLIFFTLGLNLFATEGSQINLDDKTYRTIKSVLGLQFGKWKPCPDFEYVSVFKTRETTGINAHGAMIATIQNEIILLNVFSKNNKYITFYKTDDRAAAFKVADHFKLALGIDVLDATGSENKWL
jgi:hypothetical protein